MLVMKHDSLFNRPRGLRLTGDEIIVHGLFTLDKFYIRNLNDCVSHGKTVTVDIPQHGKLVFDVDRLTTARAFVLYVKNVKKSSRIF